MSGWKKNRQETRPGSSSGRGRSPPPSAPPTPAPAPAPAAAASETASVRGSDYAKRKRDPDFFVPGIYPAPAASTKGPPLLLDDYALAEFIRNGYITIPVRSFEPAFHSTLSAHAKSLNLTRDTNPGNNILQLLPALNQVYQSAEVRGALTSILGNNYSMHPHRHPHNNPPGFAGQQFHRDSYWGFSTPRHVEPRLCMAMYYPDNTTLEMGPTSIVPGSQFHGCPSSSDRHFDRMPESWNCRELRAVCPAGTVIIIHYDLWHKGTVNMSSVNRLMFKFQFLRMEEPQRATWLNESPEWPLPSQMRGDLPAIESVWRAVWEWMRGERCPGPRAIAAAAAASSTSTSSSSSTTTTTTITTTPTKVAAEVPPVDEGLAARVLGDLSLQNESARLQTAFTLAWRIRAAAAAPASGRGGALADPAQCLALLQRTFTANMPVAESSSKKRGNARVETDAAHRACGHALAHVASPEAVDTFRRVLVPGSAFSESIRQYAAFFVGTMGVAARTAVPELIHTATNDHPWPRQTACEALGWIANGAHYERCTPDTPPAQQLRLAALLSQIRAALLASATDQRASPQVRQQAVLALARMGPAAAGDPSTPGGIKPGEVEAALEEVATCDPDRYVRGYACDALRRIGTPQAIQILLDCLSAARWCPLTTSQSQF